MNDEATQPEVKETAIIQEPVALPAQQSATDTSNWDNKVSVDPSGEKYIRTLSEDQIAE
jgi:hypothetical protein